MKKEPKIHLKVNTFALDIWYDEGKKCSLYTVKWITDSEANTSETDKFFDIYADTGHNLESEALMLFRLLTESIANKYGAINPFFDRLENKAQALPPKPKRWIGAIKELGINFPLRLFCFRISEQIVVLFGGGIKDGATAQQSSLRMQFYEAQMFANAIEEALQDGWIEITEDGRYLKTYIGNDEIIL